MEKIYTDAGEVSHKSPRAIKVYVEKYESSVRWLQKLMEIDGHKEAVRRLANAVRNNPEVRPQKAKPTRPGAFKRPDRTFRRLRKQVIQAKCAFAH